MLFPPKVIIDFIQGFENYVVLAMVSLMYIAFDTSDHDDFLGILTILKMPKSPKFLTDTSHVQN